MHLIPLDWELHGTLTHRVVPGELNPLDLLRTASTLYREGATHPKMIRELLMLYSWHTIGTHSSYQKYDSEVLSQKTRAHKRPRNVGRAL